MKRAPRSVLLAPIRLYRRFLSPALPARCKYYPSCSRYAEEAISELGVVRGSILAAWRVLRCNPLSWGGVDELSDRRLFRGAELRSERGEATHQLTEARS
ncbi:membrane protein insertion efficiency factor YidD [Thermoleophilia bacterium SCSIO 60948]|nr:membrane protein insertion efficiency factor YidD [Thermoleophilia bacterium SCSIO 60948]